MAMYQQPQRPVAPQRPMQMAQIPQRPSPMQAAQPRPMSPMGGAMQSYGGGAPVNQMSPQPQVRAMAPQMGAGGGNYGGMLGSMGKKPMSQMSGWNSQMGGGGGQAPFMQALKGQNQPPFMQALMGGRGGMPQEQSRFAGSSMPGGSGAPGGGGMLGMPVNQSYAPQTQGRGGVPMGQGGSGYSNAGGDGQGGGGGDAGGDYGGGTDEYNQSLDVKGKRKFKHAPWLRKANKKLPPWMQNQGNYETIQNTIADILGRKGQISPEALIREQADVEQGRQGSQQGLQARMAQAGIDPSSPQAMSMGGTLDQAANRLGVEGRRTLDLQAEDRQRNDLNLMIPYLQAMLGMTTKHGGGGVQALQQQGGGGGGPDYAGMGANLVGQLGSAWLQNR